MPRKPKIPADTVELRHRAEARLRAQWKARRLKAGVSKSVADAERLLQELQVHQVELEMQNADLQAARDRMETVLEKYTDLYDFAPVGYFSLDEQGRILEANLTGAALIGVERSRLINRRLLTFVVPASQPVFLAFLKHVFARTGKQACEAALIKQGAATFWAGFHGICGISADSPGKWCRVAISDITSIKQAEEMLRQNEALFSALVQQAPVGVYVVDGQLRLQQINPKARPVFRKVQPLDGRDFAEIIHLIWPAKTADEILGRFRHTLKTGKPHYSTDFTERRRDSGVVESYEWQLQRIILPAGRHGVVCFFNNITERKRAEATQRRMEVLAASNRKLEKEIVRRRAVEGALKQSEQDQTALLDRSRQMQEQLRHLSHQILQAQEEERKRISRELHDEIAQTLTGINVRLAGLKAEAGVKGKGLQRKITSTQRLVEKSVKIVHRFARELRPSVLDDLGLIPALHTFVTAFAKQAHLRVRLRIFAGVEQLDAAKRTVLYRVAQESLTNVARHARATHVDLSIEKLSDAVHMKIKDDGKSFPVEQILHPKKNTRLGLLGMRERVEMVGGRLTIESAPGQGTTIEAQIPMRNVRGGGGRRNRVSQS